MRIFSKNAYEGNPPPTPPGGSDTQIQYNNGGAFGGIPIAVYEGVTGIFSSGKAVVIGDPTQASVPAIFLGDALRLLANNTYTGIDNLINILSFSELDWTPSGDTNSGSGFGAATASAGGNQLTLSGTKNFNGGIPLNGSPFAISGLGSFGSAQYNGTTGTLDTMAGILFASTHNGYGATATLLVGGVFSAGTADDAGLGTPTGSVTKGVGGYFYVNTAGCTMAAGVSGQFDEPSGTKPIASKTAVYVNGSNSYAQTVITTTGTINALPNLSSYIKFTGAGAITLNGIANTFDGKIIEGQNATGNTITINNLSASAASGQKIHTTTGAAISVTSGKHFRIVYDTAASQWELLSPEA